MKAYRKRIISAVLAAAMAFSSVGITAYAEGLAEGESGEVSVDGSVSVNAANFPDAAFRDYISQNFDADGNNVLSSTEIKNAKSIFVGSSSVSDLKGIEYFTALEVLYCYNNNLTALDVSSNTALKSLGCNGNRLTSLNVSNNTALTYLDCSFNQLTSLNLSKNTKLEELRCYENKLTSLDVRNCPALTVLIFNSNKLTGIDLSKNTALKDLFCGDNQLTSLDLSKNTALVILSCQKNQLTSLDVSKNTALNELHCNENKLTGINVSANTALAHLNCADNSITSLDVSKNTELVSLNCDSNSLKKLDVSKNTKLLALNCSWNSLTSLDVSNQTTLYDLYCYYNKYTLSSLSLNELKQYGFNPSKASEWTGASYNAATNSLTNVTSETVTYIYDMGNNYAAKFSLIVSAPKVPSKPANVKATAGDKQVTLSWTAAEGATSYTIYKYENGKYGKVTSTTDTSFTIKGLANGTTYKFLVRAFNANGGNAFTTADLVSVTPKSAATTVPAKPTVTANVQDKVVTFSWNAVAGATYYKLYNYSNGKYGLIATVNGTSYRLRYLKNGTTYKVLVRAFNEKGGSKFTTADLISVTPKAATAVPTAPSVKASVSGGNVNLTWAHIPTAFSYTIYKYENGTYTKLGATCDNYFTVKGLAAGKTYSILVRAFNSKGGHKVTSSNRVSVTL